MQCWACKLITSRPQAVVGRGGWCVGSTTGKDTSFEKAETQGGQGDQEEIFVMVGDCRIVETRRRRRRCGHSFAKLKVKMRNLTCRSCRRWSMVDVQVVVVVVVVGSSGRQGLAGW